MIRGLYTSAAGMAANSARQEVLTRNIENMDTPGYKGDQAVLASFPSLLISLLNNRSALPTGGTIGELGTGVAIDEISTLFDQGNLEETDRALDVAIQGSGFFVLQTTAGQRVTRNGAFEVDGRGRLVTADGDLVLGVNGPISVGTASDVKIERDGRVLADGQVVDRLLLVDFARRDQLVKTGGGLFAAGNAQATIVQNPQVFSGSLESSNVDQVKTMTEMISVLRAYEASQRMIRYQDETLQKAVNEIGRIG